MTRSPRNTPTRIFEDMNARQFFEFPETVNILAGYLDPSGDTWRLVLAALDPRALPDPQELQEIAVRVGSRSLLEAYANPQDITQRDWANELARNPEAFKWFRENTSTTYFEEQIADMVLIDIVPELMVVLVADYWMILQDLFYERMWEDLSRELSEIIIRGAPKEHLLPGFIPWEDLRHAHYSGISNPWLAERCLGLVDFTWLRPKLDSVVTAHQMYSLNVVIRDIPGIPEMIQWLCVDCGFAFEVMLTIVCRAVNPATVYREVIKHQPSVATRLWECVSRVGPRGVELLELAVAPPRYFGDIARCPKEVFNALRARWPKETVAGLRAVIVKNSRVLEYLVEYSCVWDGATDELSWIGYLPRADVLLAYYYSGRHAEAARRLAAKNNMFVVDHTLPAPSEYVPLGFRLLKRWVARVIERGSESEIDYVLARRAEWC